MTQDEARALIEALIEEIDEDVLLGSMLYAMTDGEKRKLQNRLVNRALAHTLQLA
jgi:hypothetical protein